MPDFVMAPRLFDSAIAECGPPRVLTGRGIVLLYNGENASDADADPALSPGVYANGQALFDTQDPARLLRVPNDRFSNRPALESNRAIHR